MFDFPLFFSYSGLYIALVTVFLLALMLYNFHGFLIGTVFSAIMGLIAAGNVWAF